MKIDKFGIDIVYGCQLRCIGCPNSTLKQKVQFMNPETFSQILKNVNVTSIKLFRLFNFGEPFLHPDLKGMFRQIKKQKFKVKTLEVSTNAQIADKHKLKVVIKNVDTLAVSCDGDGTPKEYEHYRTPAKWDKLMTFLKTAKHMRDKHNPKCELITRTICTTKVGRKRWTKILKPLGWKPIFRGWNVIPNTAETLWKKAKIPSGACVFLGTKKGHRLYVNVDGTVVPCCRYPQVADLGNLLENKYTEILGSQKRKAFVRAMKKDRKLVPICDECNAS